MADGGGNEDDDAWLYGENNNEDQRKEEINAIFERATEDVSAPTEENPQIDQNGDVREVVETAKENGEVAPEEGVPDNDENREDKDSDDDDDSDDNVKVTIGDIKPSTTPYSYGSTPVNLNIKRSGAFSTGVTPVASGIKMKGIDIDTMGMINGVSIYEFNLDTIEDKPWRKPGADITDYFNYGFNEDSWKAYCEKQKRLRLDNNVSIIPKPQSTVAGAKDHQIPIATVNENSKYAGYGALLKKAGPPPGRRMSGSIDVICGANSAARRAGAKENVIQVLGRTDTYDGTIPGMPPTHIPPPFIPPNLSVPPPGVPPGIPPPTMPPGHVPFPNMFGNPMFSQPPPPVPPVDISVPYDDQYYGQSRNYDGNSENTQQSWANSPRDRDRDRDRHRDRSRDKDREHYPGWDREHDRDRPGRAITEEEYLKRREEYERRRYRDYRDRRDKDRHERDYDRTRDREYHGREREEKREFQEKERDEKRDSREHDRERKHRDYKEHDERQRERQRRRHHHEEEEEEHHSSSRHKAKKSKRSKDDAAAVEICDTTSQDAETEEKES